MKILIIARGYPSEQSKMNGIFEFDQAKALANNGNEVTYIALDMRSICHSRKWGVERKTIDNIKIYALNLPLGRIPKKIMEYVRIYALKIMYKKVIKESKKPDIIHSHFIQNGHAMVEALKEYKIPLVLTEHYSEMNKEELEIYYKKLGEETYKKTNLVIAVSNTLANNLSKNFNIKPEVVNNVLDLTNFNIEEKLPTDINEDFSFVSVGRLTPGKRMDLLIYSFYEAFKSNDKIKLFIYGDGSEYKRLSKIICALNMDNQIFLRGMVNRKEIAEQMKRSNSFVSASEKETFGVAHIEALAMGLPVVSTKSGGPDEFINKTNGILVPINNQKMLSKALLMMYNNHHQYNSSKLSMDIRKKFSADYISKELMERYLQLLK